MIFKAFDELNKKEDSKKIIKNAFIEIKPKKNSETMVIILLSIVLACITSFSNDTVLIIKESLDKLFDVQLAVFGIIFTAFSIILTFLDDDFIKKLSSIDNQNQTFLTTSIKYYSSILYLYFIGTIATLIIMLFMNTIKNDFTLFSNNILNNMLVLPFVAFYCWFTMRILWELKSVIYNTFSIFKCRILYSLFKIAEKDKPQEKAED
ncbi:MAG: hypothetical protein E7508_04975 [Ruminococcus sp.]|nr:hypothetical protein [Ruminococcus sp.]